MDLEVKVQMNEILDEEQRGAAGGLDKQRPGRRTETNLLEVTYWAWPK